MNPQYMDIVADAAEVAGIDKDLAIAIAAIESSWDPWAVRFEKNWNYTLTPKPFCDHLGVSEETEITLQKCSWGLMQVMGSVAREMGFRGPLQQLCAPKLGAQYGCAKLSKLMRKHQDEMDTISSYNQGYPGKGPDGKYLNQAYVDRVVAKLRELRTVGTSA